MNEFRVGVKSIIIYDKRVLIIKKIATEGGVWEFPGGIMEFGEDLHTALRREIKEETGLENIVIDKLVYAMTAKVSEMRQVVGIGYLSYADSDKVILSEEHTDFKWVNKVQLFALLNERMVNDLIENHVDLDFLETE